MGVFATSGACLLKAGAGVSTAFTEAQYDQIIEQAQSTVNVSTRKDWSGAYATLSNDVKFIIEEATSDLAAMYLINYDLSGYPSRISAETQLDVLRDSSNRSIQFLKGIKNQTFMLDA